MTIAEKEALLKILGMDTTPAPVQTPAPEPTPAQVQDSGNNKLVELMLQYLLQQTQGQVQAPTPAPTPAPVQAPAQQPIDTNALVQALILKNIATSNNAEPETTDQIIAKIIAPPIPPFGQETNGVTK